MKTKTIRTYTELMKLKTFDERFEYLRLNGNVGRETFGFYRYLNQRFYNNNPLWDDVREKVIIRDCGCDLAIPEFDISNQPIYIHHMNPIDVDDILDLTEYLLNPEFLICTSKATHNAIHYSHIKAPRQSFIGRTPNDTCPWKH